MCLERRCCWAGASSPSGLWCEIGLLRYQVDNHAIVYMPFGNHTHCNYIVDAKFRDLRVLLCCQWGTGGRVKSHLLCFLTFKLNL